MINVNYLSILAMAEDFKRSIAQKDEISLNKKKLQRLILKHARQAVSGATLSGGRVLNRRTGNLYKGLKVETSMQGELTIVSTARSTSGVDYGEVLDKGATIYPKTAKALVFRVPSSARPHIGYGKNGDYSLVFAKKVTIPAFDWKDTAIRNALSEALGGEGIDITSLLGDD